MSVLGGPRQRLDLFSAFKGWLDDTVAVVPETTIYPEGETAEEAEKAECGRDERLAGERDDRGPARAPGSR